MKKKLGVLTVLFTWALVFSVSAQVIFHADFGDGNNAIPKPSVNKANSYKGPAGTVWANEAFVGKGAGKKGLKQTAEGCGISGDTKLPGVTKFTNGIIQFIFSFGDDDGVGLTFRKKGEDKGYLVAFGWNETAKVIIASYADGCCPDLQCLDQCGCENGGKEKVGEDHGFGAGLPQDNSLAMFGRVEVQGKKIRVWYKKLADVKGANANLLKMDMRSAALGKPTAEYANASYQSAGTVGIWHESWGQGIIDSILVTGSGYFAVDAKEKLASSWGYIKNAY